MKDEKLLKEIGERIYIRRRGLKLTQEEVAEKMNVSIQMISNLELGKKAIRPENLVKISSILNVSTDYILTGKKSDMKSDLVAEKISQLSERHLDLINEVVDICLKSSEK